MRKLKSENLFHLLYILYIVNQVLSESQFINMGTISKLLFVTRYVVLGALLLFIAYRNKSGNKFKTLSLIFMTFFLLFNLLVVDGGLSFIPIVLFIWASIDYSVEKMFKISMWALAITHIFVILCAHFGIVADTIDFRYIGDYAGSFFGGAYYRHNMGFLVHNQIPLCVLIVYLMYIAYKQENIRWYESVAMMILNFIVFNYFGSRIVFIITVVVCVAYYLIKISKKLKRKTKKNMNISFVVYPICTLASFIAVLSYNNRSRVFVILDLFFNNRLRLGKKAIDFYGIGLFGKGQFAGTYNSSLLADNTVDNGYIAVFLQNGVIVALILIGIWTYLTYLSGKKKNRYLTLVFIMLAIENVVNSHLGSFKLLPFFCMLLNQRDPFIEGKMLFQSTKRKFKRIRFKVI